MSISNAIHELESVRQQLQADLIKLDAERADVASELASIDDALSALRRRPDGDISDPDVPRVLEYTGKYRSLWRRLKTRLH